MKINRKNSLYSQAHSNWITLKLVNLLAHEFAQLADSLAQSFEAILVNHARNRKMLIDNIEYNKIYHLCFSDINMLNLNFAKRQS